jgi:hypothetical protein
MRAFTRPGRSPTEGPLWLRTGLIALALGYVGLMLLLPLSTVFLEAFREGLAPYLEALKEPDTVRAIRLTLLVATISVPLNLVMGLVMAWAVTKHDFRLKSWLITFIDLPFSSRPSSPASSMCWCSARRAGSAPGWKRAASRSSSRCRESCWRRCSLPSRSSCARSDPADAGAGPRDEEAAAVARRERLADLLACHPAQYQMGAALRRAAVQRPRHGRVRRGVGGFRAYSRRDQHHAAAYRGTLQRLQLRGAFAGGLAARRPRAGHPRRSRPAGMALRRRARGRATRAGTEGRPGFLE